MLCLHSTGTAPVSKLPLASHAAGCVAGLACRKIWEVQATATLSPSSKEKNGVKSEYAWQSRDPALVTSLLHAPARAANPFSARHYFSLQMPSYLADPYISRILWSLLGTWRCLFCLLSTVQALLKLTQDGFLADVARAARRSLRKYSCMQYWAAQCFGSRWDWHQHIFLSSTRCMREEGGESSDHSFASGLSLPWSMGFTIAFLRHPLSVAFSALDGCPAETCHHLAFSCLFPECPRRFRTSQIHRDSFSEGRSPALHFLTFNQFLIPGGLYLLSCSSSVSLKAFEHSLRA